MNIGAMTKAWREAHGLTIREAADLFGMSRNALYRLECGKSVRLDALAALMRFVFSKDRLSFPSA